MILARSSTRRSINSPAALWMTVVLCLARTHPDNKAILVDDLICLGVTFHKDRNERHVLLQWNSTSVDPARLKAATISLTLPLR